jgi:hypothetical protein
MVRHPSCLELLPACEEVFHNICRETVQNKLRDPTSKGWPKLALAVPRVDPPPCANISSICNGISRSGAPNSTDARGSYSFVVGGDDQHVEDGELRGCATCQEELKMATIVLYLKFLKSLVRQVQLPEEDRDAAATQLTQAWLNFLHTDHWEGCLRTRKEPACLRYLLRAFHYAETKEWMDTSARRDPCSAIATLARTAHTQWRIQLQRTRSAESQRTRAPISSFADVLELGSRIISSEKRVSGVPPLSQIQSVEAGGDESNPYSREYFRRSVDDGFGEFYTGALMMRRHDRLELLTANYHLFHHVLDEPINIINIDHGEIGNEPGSVCLAIPNELPSWCGQLGSLWEEELGGTPSATYLSQRDESSTGTPRSWSLRDQILGPTIDVERVKLGTLALYFRFTKLLLDRVTIQDNPENNEAMTLWLAHLNPGAWASCFEKEPGLQPFLEILYEREKQRWESAQRAAYPGSALSGNLTLVTVGPTDDSEGNRSGYQG